MAAGPTGRKEHVGPRITEATRFFLVRIWPTQNHGAQWILESFPKLYDRTLKEIKGIFTKSELSLVLDAAENLTYFPEMAGQIIAFTVMDSLSMSRMGEEQEVDSDILLRKMTALTHYQRAMIEVWAQGYWLSPGDISKGEYIKPLT